MLKNKKCFAPSLYSERRFEEIFIKGEVLKKHDDRNVNKLGAYGRLLHHMISNIIIPNVGHKSSITNMHSFVMLALHEHRRMNLGFMDIEHMLAIQSSSTKYLPYGCFITKIFQYFVLNLVGVGDPIGAGKIYNKHTFKRMNESDEHNEDDEGNKEQEAMNVDEEDSETEPEEETHRREIRQKKRQERAEEERNMYKRSLKGNLHRSKRSLKTTRVYEDEVIKLNTLKTRLVRGIFKVTL
ncbi:hypothetical protein M9H77_16582 [Catharanthus roseus]|uniref:Uncharacterized protein n=1 Tax=Catharanthus roseus TaxID=4058 RepID=A0ACC0B258_CATRO|nr:hypothetical protein M9H77_16582 [Catharanthus roseus]